MWNSGSHWKRRRSLVAYDLNHHQRRTTIDELTAARRSGSVQAQALGDWRKDATLNVGQPILMGHSAVDSVARVTEVSCDRITSSTPTPARPPWTTT